MAPMQWPGTTAVLNGPAGFEAEPARAAQITGAGQDGVGPPPTMPGLPSGIALPCRVDPELFFAESPEDVEYAKSLCRGCAARIACLTGAVERREPWGVWGGELFARGEVVPRKRPRGRPRKSDVAA
jgi:WhiB family transcriptional regulator, redox-sensing transcriptional regulator